MRGRVRIKQDDARGNLRSLSGIDGADLHRFAVPRSGGSPAGSVLALPQLRGMARWNDPVQPPTETSWQIRFDRVPAAVSPAAVEAVIAPGNGRVEAGDIESTKIQIDAVVKAAGMGAGERLRIMESERTTGRKVWSIVLAGGEGERVKPFVHRWLGQPRPKQYCTFVGSRSMFEHTLDRATMIASPKRTVAVTARHHRNELRDQLFAHVTHKLIEQPSNRDTAAGIFLPLSYVRARDPQAMVVIQPSDHFVYPEWRFVETVRHSVASVEAMPDHLMLLGVQPDRLETEYGWICRGVRLNGSSTHPVHAVSSFLEKPWLAQADTALRAGGLWNTLVLTTTVDALWKAGWACFPDMMSLFERLCSAWGTPDEADVREALYREMPQHNFSSHLLQRVPERVAVIELTGVLWSDWGKPERIAESLRRIGKIPAFPLDCLERPFAPNPIPQQAEEILASV